MRDYKSLCHTRWDCKYHIVFIPKKRRKLIFGNIRKHLGKVFHDLARQKGVVIEEGHLMRDHVHMCLSIPKVDSEISMEKHFGLEDIMYQQLGLMKIWLKSISVIKKKMMFIETS